MLHSLVIENLAIVSRLELDFNEGMTAFTGETGAGKSIMIDALMLAMGGRGDPSIIRNGEAKCTVSALFSFEANSEPALWLAQHDLLEDDAHDVWLRRVISTEGRSKAYINGIPTPLQKVKAFSELLLDIHGQHQHQRLLKSATHRMQLDQYADHNDLLENVYDAYQTLQKLTRARAQLHAIDEEEAAFLRYQIKELEALDLIPDEVATLHEEHQLLHHAKRYLEDITTVHGLLHGGEDGYPDVGTQLHQITQHLAALPMDNNHIKAAAELIDTARIQCEEAINEVEAFAGLVQLDPERLQVVEARLSALHDMARKYHVEPHALQEKLTQLIQKEASISQLASSKAHIEKALLEANATYAKAAHILRDARKKQAKKLEADITHMLKQLDIKHGKIELKFTPLESPHPHGLDKIEYYVSTNSGVKPDALAKIASGGELSRISLAIQVITAKRASTPTLFFDEVDVGIGGATAARVGQLLRTLGERLQVFCVTHQPQVAATAHHHLMVKKHANKTHTFSEVHTLCAKEREAEIARMLGGLNMTEETQQHAKALLLEGAALS